MKIPRFNPAGILLAVILPLFSLPLNLIAASKVEVLIDFTDVRTERSGQVIKSYEYSFGSWEKHVTDLPGRGALVQAKDNKGGLGENNPMVKFPKDTLIALTFVIGNANNAKALSLNLTDDDGTEQHWTIPLENLPKGQPQIVALDLNKCSSETKPGKTPGMNLKKIASWQIGGDYTEPNLEVLLIKLIAAKKS